MVISYYQPSPLKLTTEEETDTFQAVQYLLSLFPAASSEGYHF